MSDNNDPNDKPSFFDSGEESNSWPPKDDYELEEKSKDAPKTPSSPDKSLFETESFDNPFSDSNEENLPDTKSQEETLELDSDDYLDQLIDNVDEKTNISNMRIVDDEDAEEEYEEKIFESPKIISPDEIEANKEETEASYEEEVSENLGIENVTIESDFQEPLIEDDAKDFDLDDLLNDTSSEVVPQEAHEEFSFGEPSIEEPDPDEDLLATGLGETAGFAFADPDGFQAEEETNNYSDSGINDMLDDGDTKPFRTFTKINLAEELSEDDEEEEGGLLAGVNRNILIILAIVLLAIGYFLFTTFFNRKIDVSKRTRRRPPKKQQSYGQAQEVLTPVWEIASQKEINLASEDKYAKSLTSFTGRPNPFAMPRSVLEALKHQEELSRLAKKQPDTYKRKAYRATLLGVLSSEDSTIALVNMQEAEFDVVEGTSKSKILSLATKSMNKAKKNTLEMVTGSFIGPWQIKKVTAPQGAFSDAKLTVEFQGATKVLSMGKAEDLGIFDPAGVLDDLDQTGEEFETDEDF